MTRQPLSVAITLPPTLPPELMVHAAMMASRLGFSAVHLAELPAGMSTESLIKAAAPALVVLEAPGENPGIVQGNDPAVVQQLRAEMDASNVTRPLLVAVPAAIGRTLSEATARAERDPRFKRDRHPREVGIFGTFQQAQDQLLALARAGADGVILDVPLDRDGADLMAQIRSVVISVAPLLLDQVASLAPPPPRTVFYGN